MDDKLKNNLLIVLKFICQHSRARKISPQMRSKMSGFSLVLESDLYRSSSANRLLEDIKSDGGDSVSSSFFPQRNGIFDVDATK
jgi:hypothetical protein